MQRGVAQGLGCSAPGHFFKEHYSGRAGNVLGPRRNGLGRDGNGLGAAEECLGAEKCLGAAKNFLRWRRQCARSREMPEKAMCWRGEGSVLAQEHFFAAAHCRLGPAGLFHGAESAVEGPGCSLGFCRCVVVLSIA